MKLERSIDVAGPIGRLWIPNKGDLCLVLFDLDDEKLLRAHRWCVAKRNGGYRAVTAQLARGTTLYLARVLLGLTNPHVHADHINRNPLDNRRENLRAVSPAGNAQNTSARSGMGLGVRGVTLRDGKYRARVQIARKLHNLGDFPSLEEAAHVASAFRAKHMEFAVEDCPNAQEHRP